MPWTAADVITSDRYLIGVAPNAVYIKTDVLRNNRPIVWRGAHHTYRPADIWVTGHSDYGITCEIYDKYSHHTNSWWTINKECERPNLHALPLGITNDCGDTSVHPIYGNIDDMVSVVSQPRQVTNLAYLNINVNTYPHERKHVYDLFHQQPWVTTDQPTCSRAGRVRFLTACRNHRFVFCPRGNGVDTHRLWETLYMGSIPIVKRHIALAEFADLPICWIDDWAEVTPSFLEAEYTRISALTWNHDKLTIGYWLRRISGAQE